MLGPFDRIDAALLQQVCDDHRPESQTLDFKRGLYPANEAGRQEFSKDVCAFANADGGDLVFGIEEDAGRASDLRPIEGDADAELRRLTQTLHAGIEPRMVGVQMRTVPVRDGFVLVVRVPSSFVGPHRYGADKRFVIRTGTQTADLTFDQLRTAFDRGATLSDQARQFRNERLTLLAAGKPAVPVYPGPLCVAHFVPLSGLAGRAVIDVAGMYMAPVEWMQLMSAAWRGGANRVSNLDGLLVHSTAIGDGDGVYGYTQLFRSAAIEVVQHGGALAHQDRTIPAGVVSHFFREAVTKSLNVARAQGISGPAVLGCALLSVEDYRFALGQHRFFGLRAFTADRNHLVLPDTWVEAVEAAANPDTFVRPMLDTLWQCFDIARCEHYDQNGVWVQPQ